MAKTYYSWIMFDRDIHKIARSIQRSDKPKNIYGVPRGGLIPAVVLSHLLGRPLILEREQISEDTMIVDDTCDSGATLARLAELTKGTVVSLCANEKRKIKVPRLLFARTTKGKWIVFPWETSCSSKRDN